ncbi:MAG TPA: hypothetical protein VGC96_04015 [Candidatus Elarobacter sp.]|jgi:hypothetical protein
MADTVVPVIAILITVGAPIAAWIISRVLRHQERMEMLRRGIVPPEFTDRRAYRAWRRAGSPWPPPGMAPPGAHPGAWQQTPQAQPWTPAPPVSEDDPQRALFKGIRVALVGLALTIGLGIAFGGYSGNPAILGGLIPMFVGVAQIIVAILSGAQLPGVSPSTSYQAPPPQPGMPPPPPEFGGAPGAAPPPPWAAQPGRPRFEELSKPVQPPDLR